MKVLLDTCVWGEARYRLREAGHDAVWTGEWPHDPGDREILRIAHAEGRILVTLDKDFGERAIVMGEAHSGIVRIVDIPAREQAEYCLAVLEKYGDELMRGAIVTAGADRTRVRPPD
ncbi:MAG: DUF5615 family PIN-like protein [Candidatus Hydrogenedentota bacterium]